MPHFGRLLRAAQQSVAWFLNRPGIQEMRAMDEDFYVVLAIQSWQRGPPFLPAEAAKSLVSQRVKSIREARATVTIAAGQQLGLTDWIRFEPAKELLGP